MNHIESHDFMLSLQSLSVFLIFVHQACNMTFNKVDCISTWYIKTIFTGDLKHLRQIFFYYWEFYKNTYQTVV